MDQIYSGTATFGKHYAVFMAVVSSIVAVVLLLVGIYLIRRKPVFTTQVDFFITNVSPRTVSTYNNTTKSYTSRTYYDLTGTIKECDKIYKLYNYTTFVSSGQTIKAWIKPNCESNEAHPSNDDYKTMGYVIIGISGFMIIFNILRVVLTRKYKPLAAIQGASGARDIFNII